MWPFECAVCKHLKEELNRERNEKRILLAAFLEKSGSRTTAEAMFEPISAGHKPMVSPIKRPVQPEPVGKHWRDVRGEAERASMKSMDITDSADALQARVEGVTNGR